MGTCNWSVSSPHIPATRGPYRAMPRPSGFSLLRIRASTATRSTSVITPVTHNRMFILGIGYVGKFFGQKLLQAGWTVSGTCKSEKKREELVDEGFDAYIFDANQPEGSILRRAKDHTHLLVSIPPQAGVRDLMLQRKHLLRNMLEGGNIQWLCYLSSTGVYGDSGGDWVDEDYPAGPSSHVAKLRLDAEKGWLDLGEYLGIASLVFRLGGIYGPGRSAVDTIMRKKPLSERQKIRSSRKYTSRVHVHDICQALVAGISRPPPSRIYNIVDDDPAPREEVFEYARELVEKNWPGLLQDDPSSLQLSSAVATTEITNSRGEKRVSNSRMKRELGITLIHATYKSGLQSIVDQNHMETNTL